MRSKRKGYEIYYFNEEAECNFIIKRNNKYESIQVCWEINKENEEREVSGLIKACQFLSIKSGKIITRDQKYERKKGKYKI